jgi:Ca2+-binding EF-hand superfamily protein
MSAKGIPKKTATLNMKVAEIEFASIFTPEELTTFRTNFLAFDTDGNGELELFELNQMYEDMKESKTHMQLKQLLQEADLDASGGINYTEYLAVTFLCSIPVNQID